MGIPLREISEDAIHALAVVLSLPPAKLEDIGTHQRAQPAASWLSEQEARISGLPKALQIPHIPHLSVKMAQVAKRVVIAASGGADAVAAKAAFKGVRLDAILHPSATPTALCQAHRGLHPTLLREIFFYITREVADHADSIRRHPLHHKDNDTINGACQSRAVLDWGHRMIGISALWCTQHTFRALEKGRQASVPGYQFAKRSHSSSANVSATSSSATPSASAPKIRSSMRLPHLKFPCEACIIAAIGARSQALIDLRAGMLSRMAEDAADKRRRDKSKRKDNKDSKNHNIGDKPARYPNLWLLIDAYINVLGKEFGEEVAVEIRERSETLAETLFTVRTCESRRRRHLARDVKLLRSERRSTKTGEKRPPRMVTKHGHRLPLPLLPLDCDLWAHYNESVVGDNSQATGGNDNAHQSAAFDADEPYFVVQENEDDDVIEEEQEQEEHDGNFMEDLGCNKYFSEAPAETETPAAPAPAWEEDYRRNVLDSETTYSSVCDRPMTRRGSDQESYVTVSVHTAMPPSYAAFGYNGSGGVSLVSPSTRTRGLSPNPGTPVSKTFRTASSSSSTAGSNTQRSTTSTQFSRSDRTARPANPTPYQTRPNPPAPASSVYSRATTATQSRQRAFPSKTKTTCSTIYSDPNTSQASNTRPSSRPPLSRPTVSSSSRSRAAGPPSTTDTRAIRASPVAAASTVFVAPSSVRTPATAESYIALQADLVASFVGDEGRTTMSSSRVTRSTAASTISKSTKVTAATTTVSGAGKSSSISPKHKPSSMAQRSAIPSPLFSDSSPTMAQISSSSSSRPSSSWPSTSRVSTSSSRASTQWPTPSRTSPSTSPSRTSHATPSQTSFSWIQPPTSRISRSGGPRVSDDVFNDAADNCSIAPDDSISVIATQRYLKELNEQARRQQKTTPMTTPQKTTPLRNLNHYQPANSRRPAQAPSSQTRTPMRTPARTQTQTTPTAPRSIIPRIPSSHHTPSAQQSCRSEARSSNRPPSMASQVTEWPSWL